MARTETQMMSTVGAMADIETSHSRGYAEIGAKVFSPVANRIISARMVVRSVHSGCRASSCFDPETSRSRWAKEKPDASDGLFLVACRLSPGK
jgi:hypothetical protein